MASSQILQDPALQPDELLSFADKLETLAEIFKGKRYFEIAQAATDIRHIADLVAVAQREERPSR